MKTLQNKTLQNKTLKNKRTALLNPRRSNKETNETNNNRPTAAWKAFVESTPGTQAQNLQRIGLSVLKTYAKLGCYSAKLTLSKFQKFAANFKPSIPSAPSAPSIPLSYDQARIQRWAAYSFRNSSKILQN